MCREFDFISIHACHFQECKYQFQYGDILTISSTTRHVALIISPIICNDSINDVNKTCLQTEPDPLTCL